MFGPGSVCRDEGQIDVSLQHGGEFHLRFFRRFLQSLQRHSVFGEINPLVLPELIHNPVHHALINVIAAEVGVAVRGLHFHHALADFQDGNVERAAAEIIYGNRLILLLVQSVGQRRCRRLVDDSQDLQPGDFPRVLRRLTLAVVEVGRHGNHGLRDFFAQVLVGRVLHLLQDHRGDLRGWVFLALRHHPAITV